MRNKTTSRHPAITQSFGEAKSPHIRRYRPPEAEPNITDAHSNALCIALERAPKRPLTDTERARARDYFEKLAAEFLVRKRYLESGRTPTKKKQALDRLESAAKRFMLALDDIDRTLWLSLYRHLEQPPKGFDKEVSAYALGGEDAQPEGIYRHFEIVAVFGEAARRARGEIPKAKSAKRNYKAARWLALELKPFYEKATGRPATANSSPGRKHKLGKRASPFVRFVAEFIEPFAPELCTSGLGEAIHDVLSKSGRVRKGQPAPK